MIEPSVEPIEPAPSRLPGFSASVLIVVFGAFLTVGSLAQLANLAWGLWTSELACFVGIPWVALRVGGLSPLRLAGLDTWRRSFALVGFAVGLANFYAWAVPCMAVAQWLLPKSLVELFDGSVIFKNQSPVELALVIAGVCIAAPACEEFLFRGVVQPGFAKRVGPVPAIVITAVLFSALHLDPVGFVARVELGVLFGLLAWKAGSIWPSVAAHAANNLMSCVAYFASGDDESELDWRVVAGMFLLGNVALALLAYVTRRRTLLAPTNPAAEVPSPPQPFLRSAAPWVLVPLASLGLLIAFDWRGIALNAYDVVHSVRGPKKSAPAERHAEWKALRQRRALARSGSISLDEYHDATKPFQRATP